MRIGGIMLLFAAAALSFGGPLGDLAGLAQPVDNHVAAPAPPVPAEAGMDGLDEFPSGPAFLVKPAACHDPAAELFSPFYPSAGEPLRVPYLNAAAAEAKAQGVDLRLLLAVIQQESSFDPEAKSGVGAVGLMQLLPETAVWLGLDDAKKLAVPRVNIRYGAKYLKLLWRKFSGAEPDRLSSADMLKPGAQMAVAAYNAGPGNVKKYCGVPPFKETQSYVRKITGYFMYYDDMMRSGRLDLPADER